MQNYVGKQIDRYRIIDRLGLGGMAVVYKAYDTRLERDVALKLIRVEEIPPSQHERLMKRFEREAKAQAKFSHPNIVAVHDYGEVDRSPYLVMEYIQGGTLKSRIDRPVDYVQALRWLVPIADALRYAHERGVIHRDVKPSNILFDEEDRPVLTDFGIAKILETDEATLTGTGMGVGTPEYMAPEQWQGKVSEATDQYALGVVLYELITGKKPYSADTPAAIAILQATEPLPQPSKLVKGIPEEVEKVLYKALARDPQDRYENMVTYQKVLLSIAMNNKYDLDDQENGKRNYYKLNHDCETDNSTYDELTDLPNTQKSSFSSNSAESHEVGSNHGKQVQDQSEKYYGKFDMNADGLFYIDGPDENDSTGDNTNSSHNKQSQINSQAFSLIIFLGIAGGLFLSISTGLPVFVIIIVIIGLAFIFIPQLISQLFEEIKAFLIRLLIK